MKRFLIVSDLDGTLLDHRQKISRVNEDWIRHFKSEGGLFTFATGRVDESVKPFIEQLEIDLPVITCNGAKLFCPNSGSVIHEESMFINEALQSLIKTYSEHSGIFVCKGQRTFILNRNKWTEAFEEKEYIQCEIASSSILNEKITKILFIAEQPGMLANVERCMNEIPCSSCRTVYSEENYLEILPYQASKGNALKRLVGLLGKEDFWTVGIGDYLNDLSLLEEADLAMVVAQAHSDVKKTADIILPNTNNEDAVAGAIQILFDKRHLDAGRGMVANSILL